MPLDSKYAVAASWARLSLTGDPESTKPTDTELALRIPSVSAQLAQPYPCVGDDPFVTLAGNDLNAWSEAVGRAVASEIFKGPQGATYAAIITEIRIGPVTEKSSVTAVSASELAENECLASEGCLSRIACIRAGQIAVAARARDVMAVTTVTPHGCACKGKSNRWT